MAEGKKKQKTDHWDRSNPFGKGITPDEIELKFDNGKSLYVSKGFLIYSSPVFERMFQADFRERLDDVVELKEKSFEVFQDMLLHMHPGRRKPIHEKHAKRIFEMSNEYQIPAVQDACEEVMAKTVSEINLIGQWEGKDHIYPGCANKTLDMIMFGSLYSLHKLIKSACENISRVPMDKITCLGKYKKLPEHCKIEILLARIKRCDRKKFYKPGMNDENDNVSTMVQCELLPTPEPPSRPLSRSGTVSPQQPANQNAANPQQQPANQNSANQLPANQNAADIQQPANQNGLNRPQWIPPPLLRPTHPMGPMPAVNPFLRPPGFSNQQQPRGVNPVH